MKTFNNVPIVCLTAFLCVGFIEMIYSTKKIENYIKTKSECYVSQTNDLSKVMKDIEKRYINRLENEDKEWSEKYNIVLKRLNNVEANMDTLDVWTGDKITVNYKNGMTKHFIVEEHRIMESH